MSNKNFKVVEITNLSYIEQVLPDLKGKRINLIQPSENVNSNKSSIDDTCVDKLDMTGNPLEYNTFIEEELTVTLKPFYTMWRKGEDAYSKFEKKHASQLLSLNLENNPDKREIPTFAICNYTKDNKSLLLGSFINESNFFTTIKIDRLQCTKVSQMESQIPSEFQEYLKHTGKQQHEVTVKTSCEYEIFGIKSDYLSDDQLKTNFKGSLSIYSKWNTATFEPCERSSENILFMETFANGYKSLLKDFWNQQLLINEYLNILEQNAAIMDISLNSKYTCKPLEFPSNFSSPYFKDYEELMNDLKLLCQEKDYQIISLSNSTMNMIINNETMENHIKLSQAIKKVPKRPNLDFTDNLWVALRGFNNYKHIMEAIYKTLEEVTYPQINATNSTLFAKVLQTDNKSQLKFAAHHPLEYLVDIAIEKLVADYMYIFKVTNLADAQEIRQKLRVQQKEFSISSCRKKLLLMAQINICLELAILAETYMNYPKEHLRRLLNYTLSKYCSENSSIKAFKDVKNFNVYNCAILVPIEILKNAILRTPLVYRIEFSYSDKLTKKRSIRVYSKSSLFPPNISPIEETDYNDDKNCRDKFNFIMCSVSSIQIPK